jgi:hypothetical protein
MNHRYVEGAAAAARCRANDGTERAIAARVLCGAAPGIADHLLPAAAAFAAQLAPSAGRVQQSSSFEDAALHAALAASLPQEVGASLRARFEWYGCFGACFHNDAHYDGVLFGVLALSGPPRDIRFPRIGVRVPASPGAWTVFDPFEPHGVVLPDRSRYRSEDYAGAPATVFVGFEVDLAPAVRAAFGVADAPPARASLLLSSGSAINAETGAVR